MFGWFKKQKSELWVPLEIRHPFIWGIFDKIRAIQDPDEKLRRYVDFSGTVRALEREFGQECIELELERDNIDEAFQGSRDPNNLYICAVSYGFFAKSTEAAIKVLVCDLPAHLKLRLLKIHIEAEVRQEEIDPLEFEPIYQYAFFEVEQRRLSDYEKAKVLEREFGISGWRTRQEMNPGNIYEPYFPR